MVWGARSLERRVDIPRHALEGNGVTVSLLLLESLREEGRATHGRVKVCATLFGQADKKGFRNYGTKGF